MVGPGALKPKVGDGIKSRRPLSAPVYTTFIHSSLFFFGFVFVVAPLLHGVYIIISLAGFTRSNPIKRASPAESAVRQELPVPVVPSRCPQKTPAVSFPHASA